MNGASASDIQAQLDAALLKRSAEGTVNFLPQNHRGYECSQEDCSRLAYAGGYCNAHYIRSRSGSDMDAPILNRKRGTECSVCLEPLNGKGGWGLCAKHYKQDRCATIKGTLVSFLGGVCSDCGQSYPLGVFDFHHVIGSKTASVSLLISNSSTAEIAEEVAKCALLCSNCHRIRHINELQH